MRRLCGTDAVEMRGLSDGHVEGVEAVRSHEDAVDAS